MDFRMRMDKISQLLCTVIAAPGFGIAVDLPNTTVQRPRCEYTRKAVANAARDNAACTTNIAFMPATLPTSTNTCCCVACCAHWGARMRRGRIWKPMPAAVPTICATRRPAARRNRSEEHTSELQSLMRISYAVFCLKKKNKEINRETTAKRQ